MTRWECRRPDCDFHTVQPDWVTSVTHPCRQIAVDRWRHEPCRPVEEDET